MSRELAAFVYNRMTGCQEVLDLVDTANGVRRMDRPSRADFDACICIGRIISTSVPGRERRPLRFQTVTFSLWKRKELESMGDLILEDMETLLWKLFIWVGDNGFPGQNCVGENPQIVVMASEWVGTDVEPNFDEPFQAWTKRIRIRFLVAEATCLPIADDCSPCAPSEEDEEGGSSGSEDIPEALFAGEAFTLVQPLQEHLIPERDLYVVNANINSTTFAANQKPGSIALIYTTPSIILSLAGGWFADIRAITTEADYWHVGGSLPANRLEHSTNIWHVRPSVSLADRMADFVIANLPEFANGIFIDEAAEFPTHYLNAYRTADEWVESELAAVTAAWNAMHLHYQARMKAHFGSGRAIVANTGGKTYANVDGIWIEDEHVTLNGVEWALARYQTQKANWTAHPNRFVHPNSQIAGVLNVKGGPTLDATFSIPGLVWPGTEQ